MSYDTPSWPDTLPVKAEYIPDAIKQRNQWCLWNWAQRGTDPKPTKPPLDLSGRLLDTNQVQRYATFADALGKYRLGQLPGIGFVLQGLSGFDLDHCRNRATGQLTPLAQEVIRRVNSYTEISPSGTGIKIITAAKLPGRTRRDDRRGVEAYTFPRYFTVTGQWYPLAPRDVTCEQEAVNQLYAELFPAPEVAGGSATTWTPGTATEDDEEVVDRCRAMPNAGDRFCALWRGRNNECAAYFVKADGLTADWSRCDMSFCALVATQTHDPEQIERIWLASGLGQNDKVQDRPKYRRQTIERALTKHQPSGDYAEVPDGLAEPIRPEAPKPEQAEPIRPEAPKPEQAEPEPEPQSEAKPDQAEPGTPKPGAIRFLRLSDLKRLAEEDQPYFIIQGMLPAGEISMPASLPWGGKSTLIAHAISCVGQGIPFLGFGTQRVPICYLNCDQTGPNLLWSRLQPSIVPERESMLEEALYMPEFAALPCPLPEGYVAECIGGIKATIEGISAERGWLIIDTMRTAFLAGMEAGSENDSVALLKFLPGLRKLARETGWAITLVHHNNRGADEYAGSAMIAGAVDVFWRIHRDQNSNVSTVNVESRRGFSESFMVERNELGQLHKIEAKEAAPDNLSQFAAQFPAADQEPIGLEAVMKLSFVVGKRWAEKTVQNNLSSAVKLGKLIRRSDVYHDPTYNRV